MKNVLLACSFFYFFGFLFAFALATLYTVPCEFMNSCFHICSIYFVFFFFFAHTPMTSEKHSKATKYPLMTSTTKKKVFTHNFHSICICIEKSAVNSNFSERRSYNNKLSIYLSLCPKITLFIFFFILPIALRIHVSFCIFFFVSTGRTTSTSWTKMEATSEWSTDLFVFGQRKTKSNTDST